MEPIELYDPDVVQESPLPGKPSRFWKEKYFPNVLIVGFGFMFLFTSFQTCGMIQTVILNSVRDDQFNGSSTTGYTTFAILYSSVGVFNWLAPSILSVLGTKWAMVASAVLYTAYMAVFFRPLLWTLYLGAALLGLGGAVIWTAQGTFIAACSTENSISRNSGIFTLMMQCSLVGGNLFVFFQLRGLEAIDDKTRYIIYAVLVTVAAIGTVIFIFLTPVRAVSNLNQGPVAAFVSALQMFKSPDFLILIPISFYKGIFVTFFSNVYGTCIGYTKQFGDMADSLVGLNGTFIGFGEIVGAIVIIVVGANLAKRKVNYAVLAGCLVHLTVFCLIVMNLPRNSPLQETQETGYLEYPDAYLAIFCSFLLGLGDAFISTQIFVLVGTIWSANTAPAFGLSAFLAAVASASSFGYATILDLYLQLSVLLVVLIAGVLGFTAVNWKNATLSNVKGTAAMLHKKPTVAA